MEESTGVHRSETSNPASAAAPIPSTKLGYKVKLIKWMRGHPTMLVGMMLAVVFGLSLREITVLVLTNPDPAAPAVTDQVDVKVSETVDLWILDADSDGFGDINSRTILRASRPPGYIEWKTTVYDCDDGNSMVHPGAPELRDGLDNDCDGIIDQASASGNGSVWSLDTDRDGFGNKAHIAHTSPRMLKIE